MDSVPAPSDDPLHARLARGDDAALAELIERERARLLRTVRLRLDPRLARRVEAEDVLQEAFVAAQQRLDHYRADGFTRPFTWLRLVVIQAIADAHRRHLGAIARDARNEIELEGPREIGSRQLALQLSGGMATPSRVAMKREALDLLADALERLGPADREVIALRHFEGLANEEVAEALGIAGKAASIRYVRALRRLKDELERVGLSVGDLHVR